MLDQLIAALSTEELALTGKEIADILWLTLKRWESEQTTASQQSSQVAEIEVQDSTVSPPSSTTTNLPEIPTAKIYTNLTRKDQTSSTTQGLPLRVPDAPSLREPIKLAQALRPLMRRVASGREMILDEIATADRTATEGICTPVFKPEPEPWLDLALVIDESKSMLIWRHTIRELKRLLEHYGIFRDVRTWGLVVVDNENREIRIRPGIGETANQQRLANPQELSDPTGRCLVLVVSDCVAAIWRNGAATSVLKVWTKTQPVAILQMLPEWLWLKTGLSLGASVRLGSLTPGVANQNLLIKELLLWREFDLDTGIKVPVLTLEPEVATTWSQMVAGKSDVTTSGFVFASKLPDDVQLPQTSSRKLEPQDRVYRFRMTASPLARKLAGLLAAAPVISLPVVRLIQETLLPQSRQVHVAEVFLGGLLKPLTTIATDTNPDTVQYDFMDDKIREILLESAPVSDSTEVLDAVSQYVAAQLGKSLEEFVALLKAPEQTDEQEQVKPFAEVTAKVLRQLGDDYARFAEELERAFNRRNRVSSESKSILVWNCYQVVDEQVDVTAICFSPDGKFIASGRGDGKIHLWNLQMDLLFTLERHSSSVISVSFNPNKPLLISGSAGGTIRLWTLKGQLRRTFLGHKSSQNSVAFSPDGQFIVSGSSDRTVRLWSLDDKPIGEPFSGHESSVNSVAFSPDGQFIVSGSQDKTIRLWDLNGNSIGDFYGHESSVGSVAFSPDGQLIVSGSQDKTIRLWSLQGEQLSLLQGHEDGVNAVAFSPDGHTLVSGSSDGTIRLWSARVYSFEVVTVNRRGEIINRETKQAQYFTEELGDGVTLEMVAIPGGKFMMGSPEGEGYNNEKPQHEVTVQPFFMSKYPITQAQWRVVATLPRVDRDLESDPSYFKGDNRPVESVSWYDAVEFCARITKASGRKYRLPSEAEWEYACRAGTSTPFYFGETLTTALANYNGDFSYSEEPKGENRKETTSVETFPPNAFGLFDMHGNIWQWCSERWHGNYEGAPVNATSWLEETENDNHLWLLLRGGSWSSYPEDCRSAYRLRNNPGLINVSIGFRVVSVFAPRNQ